MMAAPLWSCHLRKSSPRYATWLEILGSDDVPIESPSTFNAALGDPVSGTTECYLLDVGAMKAAQKHRLAEWIVQRFGASLNDALEGIHADGFPIRAEDVSVSFSLRAFI